MKYKCTNCGCSSVRMLDGAGGLAAIGKAISGKKLADLGPALNAVPGVADAEFITDPVVAWTLTYNGEDVMIVNADAVSDADLVVGDLAIGYL